jgi:hypothetical protein
MIYNKFRMGNEDYQKKVEVAKLQHKMEAQARMAVIYQLQQLMEVKK